MAKAKLDSRMDGNGMAFGPAAIPQFEPFLMAGGKVFEVWTAIGNELIEFGKARVDQSIEMGEAMARSSSLTEVVELQAKFAQSMISDFLGEASKLADMSTRSMIESLAAMQKTTHSRTPPADIAG